MSSTEIVTERFPTLYTGRGLRAELFDDGVVELSVNLHDLVMELDEMVLRYLLLPTRTWLPLTTMVGGLPELVWEADNGLIPTHVPTPPAGLEDRSPGISEGVPTEGEGT